MPRLNFATVFAFFSALMLPSEFIQHVVCDAITFLPIESYEVKSCIIGLFFLGLVVVISYRYPTGRWFFPDNSKKRNFSKTR